MEEVAKKPRISAASARSHTRNGSANTGSAASVYAGLLRKVVLVLTAIVGALVYKAITPPPVKVLNSPGGPQVSALRVQMRDGRYLAYKEQGVEREAAKRIIVSIHGYSGSRHLPFPVSKEVVAELGIHIVTFDRAGYGQSDPNPKRSIKSEAEDVEDLADGLSFGPTFFVIATSIGGYTGWGLIKYIPERLAGVAFSAPAINYWWPGYPPSELKEAWNTQRLGDKLSLRVAHYVPALTYWYMTQKYFPTSSAAWHTDKGAFNQADQNLFENFKNGDPEHLKEATQQGTFESLYKDMIIMYSNWEFTPMSLANPFINSSTSVHIWQGTDDYFVPVVLQRVVARSLPWVQYHELPGEGHFLNFYPNLADKIVSSLIGDFTQNVQESPYSHVI